MKNKILEYVKDNQAKKKSEGFYPTYISFVDMQNDFMEEMKVKYKKQMTDTVNELVTEKKIGFTKTKQGISLFTNE